MQRMEKILGAANDMQKRGLIKDPKAKAILSRVRAATAPPRRRELTIILQVNRRGLLDGLGSLPTSLSDLLQTLDLPTPQPIGLKIGRAHV